MVQQHPESERTQEVGPHVTRKFLRVVLWIQIPLILVTGVIYAYVWTGLRPLFRQREQLKAEIDSMKETVKVLRQQINVETEALNSLHTDIKKYGGKELQEKAYQVTPITTQVKLNAKAEPTDLFTKDKLQKYRFSVWVEGPPEVMDRIAKVRYEFNHPTFVQPVKESTNRENQFRVGYTGWGCLSSVIVTFTLVNTSDGNSPKVDFDMCSACCSSPQGLTVPPHSELK